MKLVEVKDLRTYFYTDDGTVKAVDGISLSISEGETLGLVGESGCGKSVTALSIMNLVPSPGKIVGGEIYFKERNLLKLSGDEIRKIRGKEISMIFQDPFTSLNPVFTIGEQIGEAIKIHTSRTLSKEEIFNKVVELLKLVELPSPEQYYHYYPHQLSGGMQQRAMIAMALSGSPSLLIADEPTTALDLTIQAQILKLLQSLQARFNMSVILITHNLGIVHDVAKKVMVMYLGKIVESAPTLDLFKNPSHPYTQGLLNAVPRVLIGSKEMRRLYVIPGTIGSPINLPGGCRFYPRCEKRIENCLQEEPPFKEVEAEHFARCWLVLRRSQNEDR